MTKDEIVEKFGDIVFLEGDNDVFNEYNWVNATLKEIYDEKGKWYKAVDRLYYKSQDEILKVFLEILESKTPITLVAYTTGTKAGQLSGLYYLAKHIIGYLKEKDKNYVSPIKYFVEQYNKGHFEYIAEVLDAEHINIDEELEEYDVSWK